MNFVFYQKEKEDERDIVPLHRIPSNRSLKWGFISSGSNNGLLTI